MPKYVIIKSYIPSVSGIYYAGTGGIFIRSFTFSRYQWVFDLLIGTLFSIVLYLITQNHLSTLSLIQSDYDRQMLNFECTPGLLIYLLLCRCLPFMLMVFLTVQMQTRFFYHLYIGYFGFIYSTQNLLSTMAYGLFALPLCAFRVFPQILFYILAFYLIWQITSHTISPSRKKRLLTGIFLLWSIGTLSEWGIHPYLLQIGIRWFL